MTAVLPAPVPLLDAVTMVRRNLRHLVRYWSMSVLVVAMPVVFLLLFVYVLGGTLGAGLAAGGGREQYLAYVVPGVLMMTVASVAQGAAITVAMDMTSGIVARFRTMSISRGAVLTGHVVGGTLQALFAVLLVALIAVVLGFRPAGSPLAWLGALAVLAMISVGVVWVAVALGLTATTVETASNLPMPLTLLPFLGSGFVPTDSMPAGLAWFARNQPFTPVMETVRALLTGAPVAATAVWPAVGWSVGLAVLGYVWARRRYERLPDRA